MSLIQISGSAGMVVNELVVSVLWVHSKHLPSLPICVKPVDMYGPSSRTCYYLNETGDQIRSLSNYEADKASEKSISSSACTKIICLYPNMAIQMCFSGFVSNMDSVMGFISILWGSFVSYGRKSMHHLDAGECIMCQVWLQVNLTPGSYGRKSMQQLSVMAASQCVTC